MGCLISIPSDAIQQLMHEPKAQTKLPPWMIQPDQDQTQIVNCVEPTINQVENLLKPHLEDQSTCGLFDNPSVEQQSVVWNYTKNVKKAKYDESLDFKLFKEDNGIESIHEEDESDMISINNQ